MSAMFYSRSENKQLKDFGALVRQARTRQGWSRDELAFLTSERGNVEFVTDGSRLEVRTYR